MDKGIQYFFFSVFALAGLVCCIPFVKYWYEHHQLRKNGVETIGEVSAVVRGLGMNRTETHPVIAYKTQKGDTVEFYTDAHTNLCVGKRIKLWYDPSNTKHVATENASPPETLILLLGLCTFGSLGFGGLFFLERERKRNAFLEKFGKQVQAEVVQVRRIWWAEYFPYQVIATWTDPSTHISYDFKSAFFRGYSVAKRIAIGQIVPVLIDADNPKRYKFDIM